MSKVKAIIVVLLLVGPAGGGAFYGLNLFYMKQIDEQAAAKLAKAEQLVLDGLRVRAFSLIQTITLESQNETLASAVVRAPASPADATPESIKTSLSSINEQLKPQVEQLQKKLKVQQLSVLSAEGRLLAGAPFNEFGRSYKGLPAVTACLSGVSRDGRYELDKKLFQVAVVPLEDARGKPVGCLMAAQAFDEQLVSSLADASGLGVALYLRKSKVVATIADAPAKELAPLLDGQSPIRFGDPQGAAPLLVDLKKKAFMARSAKIPGGTDPVHLAVVVDVGSRLAALKEAQMMVFYATGALFVFGLLLGLILSGRGVDKQVHRLRDSVRLMAEGNGFSIEPDNYSGIYQELARDLTRLGSGKVTAPSYRSPESVSQILGPSPSNEPEPIADTAGSLDFESLLDGQPPQTNQPSSAPPPASAPAAAPLQPAAPVSQPPVPPPAAAPVAPAADGGKGPKVDMPGDLAGFFDDGDPEATREMDSVPPEAFKEPAAVSVPPPPVAPAAPPPPLGAADGGYDAPNLDLGEDEDDQVSSSDYRPDATVIASVPDELLKAASSNSAEPAGPQQGGSVPPPPTSLPKPPVAPAASMRPAGSPEDNHFREVFQQFIHTKQQCGESTAGLTEDKFVEKLRKNSGDLKSRYNCKSVKFQVYVKNGKAALKATPIK